MSFAAKAFIIVIGIRIDALESRVKAGYSSNSEIKRDYKREVDSVVKKV